VVLGGYFHDRGGGNEGKQFFDVFVVHSETAMGDGLSDGSGVGGAMEARPVLAICPKSDPVLSKGVVGVPRFDHIPGKGVFPLGAIDELFYFEGARGGFPSGSPDGNGVGFEFSAALEGGDLTTGQADFEAGDGREGGLGAGDRGGLFLGGEGFVDEGCQFPLGDGAVEVQAGGVGGGGQPDVMVYQSAEGINGVGGDLIAVIKAGFEEMNPIDFGVGG